MSKYYNYYNYMTMTDVILYSYILFSGILNNISMMSKIKDEFI